MERISFLYEDCPFCVNGKQIQGGVEIDCLSCGGAGIVPGGTQVLDTSVFSTYKIMEATLASEYNALSAANKDAYRQIVSCGIVDLTDGTSIRTKLWNIFDSESTTRAALITLLGE